MTTEDRVQVAVTVNGKQGINELGKLEMSLNEAKFAMKGLKKGSDEYVAASQKYNTVKKRIDEMRQKLGLQGMTMQQLRRYQRDLTREMDTGVTRGTKRYAELNQKIVAVNRQIARQRAEMRGATGLWNSLSKQVKQFGVLALGYLGFTTLTAQLSNLIGRAGDFSDALGQVRKTTGLTAEEVEDLNAQLKKLDTRTARKELLAMGKIAGKLGITAKNDVLGFIAAADKINVALGEDLGDPEQSMRKLGKLIESFKVKDVYGIEDSLLKVGSAINHLGKSSTANEGFIVDFTRRMGGIAPLAKVTIQDILGLAAASDALGLTQEVTSTALSKLFIKMTANREVFAKFTKDVNGNQLSLEDYSRLIDTDFNEAFLALLRGVKDNSQGMIALSETLSDLELDGGRVVQVLGTLSNNTKLIGEQQKISNDEFAKGTSVLNEYNLMNETFGATLDKIRKALFAKFVNSSFVKGLERIASLVGDAIIPQSETAIDRTQRLRAELNLELEALKNGNFSAEHRKRIIDDINNRYKDYLPNLISERDTYQDINELQEEANRNLLGKILLMERENEINEILKEQVQAQESLWALEKKRQDLMFNPPEDDKPLYDQQMLLIQNQKALNQAIVDAAPEKLEQSKNKFEDIAKDMGTTIDDLMSRIGGASKADTTGTTTISTASDKDKEAYKDYISTLVDLRKELDMAMLDSEQQEVARVEAKYEALMNEAVAYREKELLSEKEFNETILALQAGMEDELNIIFQERQLAYQERRQALKEEINLELMGDREREIFEVQQHYDRLIREAEKHSQDTTKLEKKKQESLEAIRDAYRQQELESSLEAFNTLAGGTSNLFGSIMALQNDATASGIRNIRTLANAQVIASNVAIIANQAAALSEAIKGASAAAASTGPAAPFVIGGYIATMVATVIGAFASIKANNRQAQEQLAALREKKNTGRAHYSGGDTLKKHEPGLGFGDEHGEYKGYVHANEFVVPEERMKRGPQVVVPSYTSAPSKVVDLNAINSTAESGIRFGAPSSSAPGADNQAAERMEQAAARNEKAVETFGQWVSVLLGKPLKAEFGNRAFEDATEEFNRKENNRIRGSLRQ